MADPIVVKDQTPEQLMELLGVSRERAEEILAIENGEWEDDVQVVDEADEA